MVDFKIGIMDKNVTILDFHFDRELTDGLY